MAYRVAGAIVVISATLLSGGLSRAQNQADGKKVYTTYCVSCHGEKGKGDGTAAASLPAKPADHTNGAMMNQLNDKFLYDIISKGGGAVGKSSFMPAWGGALTDAQIRDVIAFIRSLAVPAYKPNSAK
jgi:mono/diheme cytochrome c family protein